MVREVEELRPEVEILPFLDGELLAQAQIPVGISGRFDDADACVPESTLSRDGKGRRIEIAAGQAIARPQRLPGDNVGTTAAPRALLRNVGRLDRHREPGMKADDTSQGPSAEEGIDRRFPVGSKGTAFAERQIVGAGETEGVGCVEEGTAVI